MTMEPLRLSPEQLAHVRGETPALNERNHLDNCGSSLMAAPVAAAILAAFERERSFGGYVAQEQQAEALESAYGSLMRLFGGKISDYAFVGSAVDGWTKAFYSLPLKQGDNLITAYNEYCSNYIAYLQLAKTRGVEIRVARHAPQGGIDLDHMRSLIDSKTRVISISHMPASSGEIIQAADVGTIAADAGVLFQLDACQSTGHVPVNVDEIGCDIMTGTSRKFLRGPRGIGFLFVNEKARSQMEPVVLTNQSAVWSATDGYTLRSDARVFEAWERSVINQVGLGAAIDYLLELGPKAASGQILHNADYLRRALDEREGVTAACPPSASSAIITFNVRGQTPADFKAYMEQLGIGIQVTSVVHTRLDLEARGIESAVRISPHYYTSQDDMDAFLGALDGVIRG